MPWNWGQRGGAGTLTGPPSLGPLFRPAILVSWEAQAPQSLKSPSCAKETAQG